MKCFLLIVALCSVSCAVPIRKAEDEPYSEITLSQIKVGTTQMQEVSLLLGDPAETYAKGHWWLFRKNRRLTEWLVLVGYMYVADAVILGAVQEHALLVEFDDERTVKSLAVFHDELKCAPDGNVCYEDDVLHVDQSIEESFAIDQNGCNLFLFRESESSSVPVFIEIDDSGKTWPLSYDEYYLRFALEAGAHTIEFMGHRKEGHFYQSADAVCDPGEELFYLISQGQQVELLEIQSERALAMKAARRFALHPD